MKHTLALLALGILTASAPSAHASEATDALSKCLVDSASQDDRRALVRWVFSVITTHPDLQGLSAVDADQRQRLDQGAAAVFERLIAKDCVAQSREAILRDGTDSSGAAFESLGSLAMRDVLQNGNVQDGMANILRYLDVQSLQKALMTK